MVGVYASGVDSNVAQLNREIRAFQREQTVVMRQAGNLLKRAEQSVLESGSPLKSGTGRKREGIGPLSKSVTSKVRRTQLDVMAKITFRMRAFYGRFHERGISVLTKGRSTDRKIQGRNAIGRRALLNVRGQPYRLVIPKRETLGPVAAANEERVITILGNSYQVFAP